MGPVFVTVKAFWLLACFATVPNAHDVGDAVKVVVFETPVPDTEKVLVFQDAA